MAREKALVAEDDPTSRAIVVKTLTRAGFDTIEATTGAEAIELFDSTDLDLVVLDNVMPEVDGEEVCRHIRAESDVPILFVSKFADDVDRIVGLELGADDYIAKPFNPRELLARVRAVMRRSARDQHKPTPQPSADPNELEVGKLRLDLHAYKAFWGEHAIDFTKTEFDLVSTLARWPSRVYTREELVARAYDDNVVVSERTIDSHVRRIREKFRDFDVDPIRTVRGVGFQLVCE
jgi:two-component system OmpR family response regulator